jgi:hypothetical protein
MSHALPAWMPSAGFGLADAVRKLPYAAFMLVIAIVAVCGMAIAAMPSRWLATAAEGAPIDAQPVAAAERVAAPVARARCVGCGVVESIRRMEATAQLPAQFEFTVRLRDGSARVSHTADRGTWHPGDRIMLMAGAGGARD